MIIKTMCEYFAPMTVGSKSKWDMELIKRVLQLLGNLTLSGKPNKEEQIKEVREIEKEKCNNRKKGQRNAFLIFFFSNQPKYIP